MTVDIFMRWWVLGVLIIDALAFLGGAVNGPKLFGPLLAAGGTLSGAVWLYFNSGLFP